MQEATEKYPRAPQRSPGGPQETPKSAQKRAKRTPRRFQDHLRIEDVDFLKIELPPRRELDFRGSEGHLGSSKSTSRSSKRRKRRLGRRQEPKKQRGEPQEAPKEPPSHDLPSLSAFQSLHKVQRSVGTNERATNGRPTDGQRKPTETNGRPTETNHFLRKVIAPGREGRGTVIGLTAWRPLTSRGRRTTKPRPLVVMPF